MLDPVCLEPLHRRHLAVVNLYSVLHRKQLRLKAYLEEPDRHQHTLYLVAVHSPYNRLVAQPYLVQNRIKVQVRIQKKCVHVEIFSLGVKWKIREISWSSWWDGDRSCTQKQRHNMTSFDWRTSKPLPCRVDFIRFLNIHKTFIERHLYWVTYWTVFTLFTFSVQARRLEA